MLLEKNKGEGVWKSSYHLINSTDKPVDTTHQMNASPPTQRLVAIAAAVLAVVVLVARLRLGVDLSDESLFVGMPFRFARGDPSASPQDTFPSGKKMRTAFGGHFHFPTETNLS